MSVSTIDPADSIPRVEILGVPVSAVDPPTALAVIEAWAKLRRPNFVCCTSVNGVLAAQDDPRLLKIFRQAGLVTPDGMPLAWIARARGHAGVRRVYGPDLMLSCCDQFRSWGCTHYLYGGAEGVPELLAEKLRDRFPGIRIVGAYSPPFRELIPEESAKSLKQINESAPDIVWVGLGAPKQDLWMAENASKIESSILMGVGAAFDFHAGLKKQAPAWMGRSGLEWLFRLLSEPRRLGSRYLLGNPRFLALIFAEELRQRSSRI
jgi:N-acetylglucosaminyldiphosphoundecaprenol N-acetyl-beta-D-mannosaminyltransferase